MAAVTTKIEVSFSKEAQAKLDEVVEVCRLDTERFQEWAQAVKENNAQLAEIEQRLKVLEGDLR